MTGNTRDMADSVVEGLLEHFVAVEVKEAFDATRADLDVYDNLLFGVYTWGDGDLPDEFLDLYDDLGEMDLSGKRAAVFGCGDSSYRYFAVAGDILQERLENRGARVLQETVKSDGCPGRAELDACRRLGAAFAAFVREEAGAK
ncbi:flavodoxin domain-containing protein [Paenibacillus sp. MWE-103]|uniref:Flavodoxin domain-containing protein n=2 Tax=Paenibacillus artemisiicola TaxID=1172618 RepID=A0ABS3WJU9_9BACL|nr:flavodoxin domain-containing protein [Paenibacillus artemisiicola]